MGDVGIFCAYLVYFVAIWYIPWQFGIFCGHLVYLFCGHLAYFVTIWHILWQFGFPILWSFGTFFPFLNVESIQIWQPCSLRLLMSKARQRKRAADCWTK
jgi:hypothetical protein